jgi:arsenate reductase (glutaredoxin)
MMNDLIFYLSTCGTCKRIIKDYELANKCTLQDIKKNHINESQLDHLAKEKGSYEALFNKMSKKYKERNLKEKSLKEGDYKNLILEEYTFLKRPVIIINNKLFIGNSPKTLQELQNELGKN